MPIKKNVSAKKMFKVGDEIECVITDIDQEKRRVAISHRLTKQNPYKALEEKYPIGSEIEGVAGSVNEYAIYIKLKDFEIDVNIINILNTLISMNNLNILFVGDSGCGKTALIYALIKEYYGNIQYNDDILIINSLKEQGIQY